MLDRAYYFPYFYLTVSQTFFETQLSHGLIFQEIYFLPGDSFADLKFENDITLFGKDANKIQSFNSLGNNEARLKLISFLLNAKYCFRSDLRQH